MLDPLAAILVSVFIIYVAIDLIRPAVEELAEKSLPKSVESKIKDIVMKNEGVHSMHNMRTRQIGNRYAIEFHVRMDGQQSLISAHSYTMDIERELKDEFGSDTHIAIHMEPMTTEYLHDHEG